jgi:universal stress protein A
MTYRKILCAIDFSEASRAAMREAAELAAKFGASLTLVHVGQLPGLLGFPDSIPDERFMPSRRAKEQQLVDEWKREAQQRSEQVVHALTPEGVAWDGIVTCAREGNFDLIVVGSHGRSGLQHVLLGSVAEKVVRHAPCPVFVVRTKSKR